MMGCFLMELDEEDVQCFFPEGGVSVWFSHVPPSASTVTLLLLNLLREILVQENIIKKE